MSANLVCVVQYISVRHFVRLTVAGLYAVFVCQSVSALCSCVSQSRTPPLLATVHDLGISLTTNLIKVIMGLKTEHEIPFTVATSRTAVVNP